MTLYELNQAGYHALSVMTEEEILEAKTKVCRFLEDNNGEFFMLLCHELRYYTLFDLANPDTPLMDLVNELFEIAQKLGLLKSVEINGPIIEFWLSDKDTCNMYAFFNYDTGVIKYE